MDRIADIARRRGLFIVEDCAEAHGTEWRGRKVGSLGTVGAFSFQMGKPLTAGEGGAVTYDDDALEMRHYQYARARIGSSGEKETVHYPAGNWRMSEFVGAILLAQLARIREQTDIRYTNHLYFADGLDEIDGISALKRDPRITKQGFYFYLMRYDPARWNGVHRDRFMAALRAEGVRCGTAHNDPVYWYEAFRDMPEIDHSRIQCPQAERIYRTEVVALGKDFLMAREHCDRILDALRKIRDNLDELANAS
jgi:dTDP-4-amino-4,6-dideoxygalactose transaminase